MQNTPMHRTHHLNWPELLEIGLFVILATLILLLLIRCLLKKNDGPARDSSWNISERVSLWEKSPEIQLLMLSLPLQLLWEIAQFPLYTVWHEGDWSYILYGLVHCTLGDLLITLSVFWFVSLLNRSRYWIFSPSFSNIIIFTALGLSYTIFSEIMNTRIIGTWGYTELMPIIPVIEVGGMPFLQWLLIPPVLIGLIQLVKPVNNI